MIQGNKIILIPATLDDREKIYNWCFHSETTKFHAGADYPDVVIPTFEEFYNDYVDYFFNGSAPDKGRGFIIVHNEEPVGFISYSSYHLKPHKAELDIWMKSEANCGKGFGTDAIMSLGNYLNKLVDIYELIIRPSKKNINAIKSYKKSGFEESDMPACDYLLDEYLSIYGDGDYGADGTALLTKRF